MKTKKISFTPGSIIPDGQSLSGHQKLPALTLPDGSQILLYDFDPVASHGRRHKRRALRLPTLDTRNEFGAWIERAHNAALSPSPLLQLVSNLATRERMEANMENAHALDGLAYAFNALRHELQLTVDKLGWLYEQQEGAGEVSAKDLQAISEQMKAARLVLKNLKP